MSNKKPVTAHKKRTAKPAVKDSQAPIEFASKYDEARLLPILEKYTLAYDQPAIETMNGLVIRLRLKPKGQPTNQRYDIPFGRTPWGGQVRIVNIPVTFTVATATNNV